MRRWQSHRKPEQPPVDSGPPQATGEELRSRLVEALHAIGSIRSQAVAAAFSEVPRELFIPEIASGHGLEAVYRDQAFVTKQDPQGFALSSSSQPGMMAQMLELLELRPGQRVLEVGAGTGYNAALLARIVGTSGRVSTVDVDSGIAERARQALRDAGAAVEVVVGDGRRGLAAGAPYDRIIVTAAADQMPRAWLDQLTEGGRLVVPLRLDPDADAIQLIPAFVRRGAALRSVATTWGGFMALHGGDGGWQRPKAFLSAGHFVRERPTSFVSLTGPGLESLSRGSGRRLLAALLRAPRPVRAQGTTRMIGGHAPAVLIYLMVTIPMRRRIWIRRGGRHGVGILDARGRGVAAVTLRSVWERGPGQAKRARWRLESWGTDAARRDLAQLLADWTALQREGRDQLEIETRPGGDTLRLRFSWKASPRPRGSARRPASA